MGGGKQRGRQKVWETEVIPSFPEMNVRTYRLERRAYRLRLKRSHDPDHLGFVAQRWANRAGRRRGYAVGKIFWDIDWPDRSVTWPVTWRWLCVYFSTVEVEEQDYEQVDEILKRECWKGPTISIARLVPIRIEEYREHPGH